MARGSAGLSLIWLATPGASTNLPASIPSYLLEVIKQKIVEKAVFLEWEVDSTPLYQNVFEELKFSLTELSAERPVKA